MAALNKGNGSGGARANAVFSASSDRRLSIHGLNLQADASSNGTGGAFAHAVANIHQDSLSIAGNIVANAQAVTGVSAQQNAEALASVSLAALNEAVLGNVDVEALASDLGAGNADALAQTAVFGTAVTIGSLVDKANAFDSGSGAAEAVAHATIDPPGSVHILGNASVAADARNLGAAAYGLAASAAADLDFAAFAKVTVDGDLVISAHAANSGSSGGVVAHGGLGFGSATNISLHGVKIDVSAVNGDGSGARATASFVQNNSAVHLNIGTGCLDVEALASSRGGGGAFANALSDIVQDTVSIAGDVTVKATAFNAGSAGEGSGAQAISNLVLHADSGNITVGGRVDVTAFASDNGRGSASATALTNLFAGTGAGKGDVSVGALIDQASAIDHGSGAAHAIANSVVDPATVTINGNAYVTAYAENFDGPSSGAPASAAADLTFGSGLAVSVLGNVAVIADALTHGGGSPNAHAALHKAGVASFHANSTIVGEGIPIDPIALGLFASPADIQIDGTALSIADPPTDPPAAVMLPAPAGPNGTISRAPSAAGPLSLSTAPPVGGTDPDGAMAAQETGPGTDPVPKRDRTNFDALQALPIDGQPYPSGGMSAIPLSINGESCGALGEAGLIRPPDKALPKACAQPPINLTGMADGP